MKTHHALATPFRVAAILSILVLAIVLGNTRVSAQATPNPPDRMTYQGFLTDANGVPLGETAPQNYDVIFRIHNDQSGGQVVWGEQQTVTVDKGYFSVLLGEGADTGDPRNALSTVFGGDDASDRYVGMTVKGIGSGGSDVDILPRLRLLSSPYSFLARNASTLVSPNGASLATAANGELTVNGVLNADLDAGKINSGTLSTARIPNLDANKINSGTLSTARIPNLNANKIVAGTFSAARIPNLDASKITTGTLRPSGGYNSYNGMIEARYGANDRFGIAMLPTIATAIYTSSANTGASIQLGKMTGASSFSPQMTIKNNGTVGIGTTAPIRTLEVAGTMYASGNVGFGGYAANARTYTKSVGGGFGLHVDNTANPAYGVYSGPGATYGVFSYGSAYAGYFAGNTIVAGILIKSGGTFRIDHPLDPENKWLSHSFVESPDMMNVYNGNIVTDSNGDATVTLPDYFEALNKDFRYQLTVIGQFAQAMVASEVSNNTFVIKTDKPEVKVSWQVTGIRHDAFAEAHRIIPETSKTGDEIGTYQHPLEHGQPKSKGMKLPKIKKEK